MADDAQTRVRRVDSAAVVEAPEYINNIGGESLAEACKGLMDGNVLGIVLNLESCNIANSVGISFLIEILESLREKDGKLAFCCVTPTIAKTFQIMGLLQTATVHESEQEALQAVSG